MSFCDAVSRTASQLPPPAHSPASTSPGHLTSSHRWQPARRCFFKPLPLYGFQFSQAQSFSASPAHVCRGRSFCLWLPESRRFQPLLWRALHPAPVFLSADVRVGRKRSSLSRLTKALATAPNTVMHAGAVIEGCQHMSLDIGHNLCRVIDARLASGKITHSILR